MARVESGSVESKSVAAKSAGSAGVPRSGALRVGVVGGGAAGLAHARAYAAAGGFRVEAVCDLIPARAAALRAETPEAREIESVEAMIKDPSLDVLSICLPTDLHGLYAVRALRAKKHVVVELPAGVDVKSTRAMVRSAEKAGRVVMPAFARHFGVHEAAARQAIGKGVIGQAYHVRASWYRAAGVPQGARLPTEETGWYTNLARSGGGALIDLGYPLLQVAWGLLGQPTPVSAYATLHQRGGLAVEEGANALLRFEDGRSIELAVSWAIHAPGHAYGVSCRVHGTAGSVDVYTSDGATLHKPGAGGSGGSGGGRGVSRAVLLKGPKVSHHVALMRELRQVVLGKGGEPLALARQAVVVAGMVEAMYRSGREGRAVNVRV